MEARDLLEVVLDGTPAELDAARQRVAATRGKGDRSLLAAAERVVAENPGNAIAFDATGLATLRAGTRRYCAGRFTIRSIGELEASVAAKEKAPGARALKLTVMEGQDPVTDIAALQAMASAESLFQVASQFNCLEAPDACLVSVADYLRDPTQGPRASVSAFPATLVRHYAAPDGRGGRFTQSDRRQIDLLEKALPARVGRVESGYLMLSNLKDLPGAAQALEDGFADLRLGVHDEAQVVLGAGWDGAVEGEPRIAQVFTSTLAAGAYGRGEAFAGPVERICRQLLRAAYLGTLLAAIDLGKRRAVLTMIGGGVFGNPHPLICQSVVWAVERAQAITCAPLEVVLNGRDLDPEVDRGWLRSECEKRGGILRDLAGRRDVR